MLPVISQRFTEKPSAGERSSTPVAKREQLQQSINFLSRYAAIFAVIFRVFTIRIPRVFARDVKEVTPTKQVCLLLLNNLKLGKIRKESNSHCEPLGPSVMALPRKQSRSTVTQC